MPQINFPIIGWLLAGIFFLILVFERGCVKRAQTKCQDAIIKTDTIRIKGDTKLVTIQDTILMPGKVRYKTIMANADSTAIITDYYNMLKKYADTVRGNDVEVVITDSMPNDSTLHRKVQIENKRDKLVVNPTQQAAEKFKMFIGMSLGINLKLTGAAAGPSVIILTKTDQMYMLHYDLVNNIPMVGMAWKLHFGK